MKKYLFGAILLASLVVVPVVSQAATIQDLECQVHQLLSLIAQIKGTSCPVRSTTLIPSCPVLPYCQSGNRVVINSVSGPTSLSVGQTGQWTVNATVPSGSNISYSVDWGENMVYPMAASSDKTAVQQTSTFTHSYSQAGNYTVKFKIVSGTGSAESSMTVRVGTPGSGAPIVKVNSSNIDFSYDYKGGVRSQNLWSGFHFDVEASGGDIYIYQGGGFASILLENSTFKDKRTPDNCIRNIYPENKYGNIPPVVTGADGLQYYKIANGKKYPFYGQVSCSVNQMFKGVYYGKLDRFNYYSAPGSGTGFFVQDLNYRTNSSRYIVGEQGPWISGVSFDNNSRTITITGERLNQVNSLTVGSLVQSGSTWLAGWVRKTDNQIVVQEAKDWPTGAQTLFVGSVVGNSNRVPVNISGVVPPEVAMSVSLSPSSPVNRSIKGSTTTITPNVVLGVFRLKPMLDVRLDSIKFRILDDSKAPVFSNLINNLRLDVGGIKFSVNSISSDGLYTFSNTNLHIQSMEDKDISLVADIQSGSLNKSIYSYLVTSSIVATDSNYHSYNGSGAPDIMSNRVDIYYDNPIDELLAQIGALSAQVRADCPPSTPEFAIPVNPTATQLRNIISDLVAQISACQNSTTPSFSNLQVDGDQATWARNSSRNISWQTNGSIPKVDIRLCFRSEGGCWAVQRGIPNTGNATAYFGSNVAVGYTIFVRITEAGKSSPLLDSGLFTVTPAVVSQSARLNQMASVLNSISSLIDKLRN
jgi:hypothetical protein